MKVLGLFPFFAPPSSVSVTISTSFAGGSCLTQAKRGTLRKEKHRFARVEASRRPAAMRLDCLAHRRSARMFCMISTIAVKTVDYSLKHGILADVDCTPPRPLGVDEG